MDSIVIEKILKKDQKNRHIFLGVFAKDELPVITKFPSCFILNTDPRSKPGEHWLAIYYNKRGFCYFFDSYGNPPLYYNLNRYIANSSNGWTWNKQRLQGDSEYCGYYSLLFLLYISRNKLSEFYNEFYFNYYLNDKKITNAIKKFI